MKYRYTLVAIIVIATIFLSTSFSFAAFLSRAKISGFSFITGNWGKPDAPILKDPKDDLFTNQDQFFQWYKSSKVFFTPETYTLEIYDVNPLVVLDATPFIYQENISKDRYPKDYSIYFPSGIFYWRIKTVDAKGQSSFWSEIRKFTVDKVPPETIISVENSPKRVINEQISNGNFEKYGETNELKQDFVLNGDVNLWKENDLYQNSAHEGNRMLVVGQVPSSIEGNNYLLNSFSLFFPNNSKTLSFYYNFFSEDEYPFDDPSFLVRINEKDIFQLSPLDIEQDGMTGWKQFYYDISEIEGDLVLDFFAGNNFDNFRQSWVYLDQISTGQVAVNKNAKFYLETFGKEEGDQSCYCFDDCSDETKYIEYIDYFSVDLQKGEHRLFFFSKDSLGNKENPQIKLIYFDKFSPEQISDLRLNHLSPNSAKLIFTSPKDDYSSEKVTGYEARVSNEYIDQNSISPLLEAWWGRAAKIDTSLLPQEPGSLEELNILSLQAGINYFVAVKSFDAAQNYSEISNIVNIFIPETPTPTPSPSLSPSPSPTPTLTPTLTLTPTPEPINLVLNGGFEIDTPFSWERKYSTMPQFQISTSEKRNGSKSLKVISNSMNYDQYVIQRIPVSESKKYRITAYIKKGQEIIFGGARLRVGWYNNPAGAQLTPPNNTVDEVGPADSFDWKKFVIEAFPRPSATIMEIRLTVKTIDPVLSASAYFDDISVEEIPP